MKARALPTLLLLLGIVLGGAAETGIVSLACGRPYPPPGAWPANRGPGGPARTFAPADLYRNCAFLSPNALDVFQHHNLVTMYDGYLLMPWAPEWGNGGLSFIDVSDPCDPRIVGQGTSVHMRETHSVGFSHIGGRWAAVNRIGRLLSSGTGGVEFWDVSDPTAPRAVSEFDVPRFFYPDAYAQVTLSLFWQAPYVYVAAADNGVYIVDALDPMHPKLAGQYQFSPILRAGQLQAIGNLLVVTAAEGARTALLDISDPAFPRPIPGGDFQAVDAEGEPRDAYFTTATDGYVFYARKEGGGGLIVHDIRDPSNPKHAGAVASEGNGGYVFLHDGLAFVGESNFAAIYDASDPANLSEVARLYLDGDLDTVTPIGNVAVLSVDDGAPFASDEGSAIAPWRETPDDAPPRVTWAWPPPGAAGVALSARLGLTFSEFVDPNSAWAGSVRLYETGTDPAATRVDGYVSAQESIVNFWPTKPLRPSTNYTLEVPAGGIADFNDNRIAEPFAMTFATAAGEPVAAAAGPDRYAFTGEPVLLDGSASAGATRYSWSYGNGDGWDAPRATSVAQVVYAAPGRYRAALTASNAVGDSSSDEAVISVVPHPAHAPRGSATVAAIPGTALFAAVSPDSNEVAVIERAGDAFSVARRIPTAANPRTVAPWLGRIAVPCQDGDAVEILRPDGGAERFTVPMPYGSRPYGAAGAGESLWVSLQGTGELAEVRFVAGAPQLVRRLPAILDARGVAVLPDGRIATARWRSPDDRGEIAVVNPADGAVEPRALQFDPQIASDTEIGGVPTYLDQILVSPTGAEIAYPSLQANVADGLYRNGRPLTFETTIRATVSYADAATGAEQFARRKQFDNRGLAAAGVWSPYGDYLYVAMRGNRTVERVDVLGGGGTSGTILDAGLAPDGLALSEDGRFLLVDCFLSREVVVYDVSDFSVMPAPLLRLPTASSEPLAAAVLRGKRLFNDSADPRLSKDGYMACAHCHFDGLDDRRVWDFTDRGEGLRNTIALLGRAGLGDGPVHWSANFDEIQDFENDIRGPFKGLGLLADDQFHAGTRSDPLGDPKAGLGEDLDTLAAYVASLASEPRSPYRAPGGALTAAAARGKTIFESAEANCLSCHAGARLTDSGFLSPGVPRLHDVGTLGPGSGGRLGGPLSGIDAPTLHGLWHSAPYLHDGSAATVRDVVTARNAGDAHGKTSHLSAGDVDDLIAYLLSLDGRRD